jgi:hypothetical protein
MNGFWDQSNFNTENDQINFEIWSESPELQRRIQPANKLTTLGSVGPQQAMLDSNTELHIDSKKDVLPWVPDLVGKRSGNKEGLLIFGAAYAGFIREYSSRPPQTCMPLSEYVKASNLKKQGMQYFQNRFLENVVKPDPSYYGKIESLLKSVGIKSDQIILSDLCHNSIVKRQIDQNGRRKDDSKQPSKNRSSVFCKYVENTKVQEWTVNRILQSQSSHIIALGHIAEHGLLRLFNQMGAIISQANIQFELLMRPSPRWVDVYADHPNKKIIFWINNKTWWTIKNRNREWRLLPIYHPAIADRYDSNYLDTKEVLKSFLS